jgi:hypothetical protein
MLSNALHYFPIDMTVPQFLPRRPGFRSCPTSYGMCGEHSGSGAGILREVRFPLPVLITPTAPHSLSIFRG